MMSVTGNEESSISDWWIICWMGTSLLPIKKNGMTVLSDKVVKDFELPGNYLPDMRQFFIDHTFEEDAPKYHAALDTLSISEGNESVDLECRIDVPAKGLQ